jgi:hypothetical protein
MPSWRIASSDPEVARAGIKRYGNLIQEDADPKLMARLLDMALTSDPETRLVVLDTLLDQIKALDQSETMEVMLQCMNGNSEAVASTAADNFHRHWQGDIENYKVKEHPRSEAGFRAGLSSRFPVVRGFCARKLVEVTPPEKRTALLPEICPLLKDQSVFVRSGAAMAIGQCADPVMLPEIVKLMEADRGEYCTHRVKLGDTALDFAQVDSKVAADCYLTAFEALAPGYKPEAGDPQARLAAALDWWHDESQ